MANSISGVVNKYGTMIEAIKYATSSLSGAVEEQSGMDKRIFEQTKKQQRDSILLLLTLLMGMSR